jgi:Ca2+:H+ antiporter
MPFAFMSKALGWNDAATFILALLSIAPLAERLGFITEQLAMHTNESIGGLLNATFGNATELIVAISALSKGLFRLVQLSLLGSILSNMLLVLGSAFFCGGFKFKTQKFGVISAQVNMSMLMLSVMGLLFPTILSLSKTGSDKSVTGFSRGTSVILFLLYLAYLNFQVFIDFILRLTNITLSAFLFVLFQL